MIHPHTHLKFHILIEASDFDQARDPWKVVVLDTFGRKTADLDKSDCFRDTIGNYYFNLPNTRRGRYYALTTVQVPDEDYDPQYMVITDRQHLVDVGLRSALCGSPAKNSCPCTTDGLTVTFTRVFTKSIDGADYLADKDGNYIYTSDGERIQFINPNDQSEDMGKVKLNMTGDEFKQLIEGTDPNGQINTLPEAMAAMQGISDDSTIEGKIKEETEENLAAHSDIDEIFNEEEGI